jgi:hypothetical protein
MYHFWTLLANPPLRLSGYEACSAAIRRWLIREFTISSLVLDRVLLFSSWLS